MTYDFSVRTARERAAQRRALAPTGEGEQDGRSRAPAAVTPLEPIAAPPCGGFMRRSTRSLCRLAAHRAALLVATVAVALPARPVAAQQPEPIKFARLPHVASDGRIAFTYQDDIWLADADGGSPRRLTAHIARDFGPRFSPDGKWIAFTSNRAGNNDVYVIPATGGEPRQLTYYSGDDQALYWTPDGKAIVISSNRGPNAFGSPLYTLTLDGAPPTPLPMAFARAGMIKQDGSLIAFNRNLPSTWRKEYRGNASANIIVAELKNGGDIAEVTDTNMQDYRNHVNEVFPMWGADGMIYYASEKDGTFNLWRMAPKGGSAPQQVTTHKDGGVFFPAISPDGKRIIYQHDFDLWEVDVPAGKPRKLTIAMAFDPKENDVDVLTAESRAEGFTVSPQGDYLAVDFHGEILIVPTEVGVGERTQVTASPWRDRNETYSPDGKKIAYISDETGEEEVWLFDVATSTRKRLTRQASEKADVVWAPSSQKLAYTATNRIFEVDVAGGEPRELAVNPAGGFDIAQYSSDGNWLVYSRRDDDQNAEIYLYDIKAKREYNATQSPVNETGAALTPDGRTLIFTSTRDGGVNQLFAVSLARLTEDPNDPLVRERVRRAGGRGGRGGAGADSAAAGTEAAIRVDVEGIERRAVQLTRGGAAVSSFFLSRDGRTIYYASGGGGFGGGGRGRGGGGGVVDEANTGLFSIGIDGRDRRRIAAGSFPGMLPTADRRAVFFRAPVPQSDDSDQQGGRGGGPPVFEIHRLALAGGAGGAGGGGGPQVAGAPSGGGGGGAARGERVSFSFPVRVDRRQEWKQLFDESWRVMKYRYYDPKMHGKDWDALKARYEPLLKYVGTNEDVYDLANEMIGELNTSHTGVSGPPTRAMPRVYTTRFLGFELEPANGKYRVSHVYRDGPADQEWIDIKNGDYVLAIDGQEIKAGDNYWKILSTTSSEYIPVKVAKTASGENAKVFRIASVTNLGNVKYEEWVENNRDVVEKETNGQIAYVHIRAMDQPSLQRFQNEIDRFWNRKGIIVDIRNNGGGNIDQELLDILERQPYQFWNNRNGARTWGRRPRQAIAGPKVMMINYRSVSDAEVTPMGFRQLGLGRIVGNPTSAQVIATGSYALINGGAIRTPGSLVITYDPSKPNNYGVDLENYGVPPDVWVKNSPLDEAKGIDRELKTAIDEAMKMLRDVRAKVADR
jgi:tricorn protease